MLLLNTQRLLIAVDSSLPGTAVYVVNDDDDVINDGVMNDATTRNDLLPSTALGNDFYCETL